MNFIKQVNCNAEIQVFNRSLRNLMNFINKIPLFKISVFYHKSDQKIKTILFLLLENNIHLMNTLLIPITFYLIKSISFDAEIQFFDRFLIHLVIS